MQRRIVDEDSRVILMVFLRILDVFAAGSGRSRREPPTAVMIGLAEKPARSTRHRSDSMVAQRQLVLYELLRYSLCNQRKKRRPEHLGSIGNQAR